ncbi:MAG: glycosyltransferase family 39 protein [Actinobacteria bacterium]|nr:glycosyltransferase family 39 protein [Actinomycetota bacterium]
MDTVPGPPAVAECPPAPALPRARAKRPRLPFPVAVCLIAVAAYAVELAVSSRYGYDRDELYFLVAGQHPAVGYVDQPALTPLLARLAARLTGHTLVGLRAAAALGLPLVIALTASMARLLGASRSGQAVAALAAACCGEYMSIFHRFTTTTVDFTFWTVLLWLVVRLLTSGDRRWWLPAGVVAGIALEAKWNIVFLIAGLAVGFAATGLFGGGPRPGPQARLASGGYFAAACAITVVSFVPDIVWQAAHGLPNLGVFRHLQQGAWELRLVYWPAQVFYTSIVLAPLWVRGLHRLLRDAQLRPAGIAAAAVLVTQFFLGGKPYYPAGIYPLLFAAGSAGLSLTAARAARYCVAGALATLVSLPVLPAAALAFRPLQAVNPELAEQVGWPREVRLVASVYRSLPPARRAHTAILAGNYGEAAAIDHFGPGLGLPRAYSGHNNFWLWGPPPAQDTAVVAIGVAPSMLRSAFSSVRQVARYANGLGIDNAEEGTLVYVATGLRVSWAAGWPAFRHYD